MNPSLSVFDRMPRAAKLTAYANLVSFVRVLLTLTDRVSLSAGFFLPGFDVLQPARPLFPRFYWRNRPGNARY